MLNWVRNTSYMVILVLFLVILPTKVCRTQDSGYAIFQLGVRSSATISCSNEDELMNITSIEHTSSNSCTPLCTHLPLRSYYLNGNSIACKNEERIRSNCEGRHSCTITNLSQPATYCAGRSITTQLRVNYRCISSEHVFNLCGERTALITEETPIIFAAPLSLGQTRSKSRCRCRLRPKPSNQSISSLLHITQKKIAQLRGGEEVRYEYRRGFETCHTLFKEIIPYHSVYLRGQWTIPFNMKKYKNIDILLESETLLTGQTRMFINVEPANNLLVECNEKIRPDVEDAEVATDSSFDMLAYYRKKARDTQIALIIAMIVCLLAIHVIVVLAGFLYHSKVKRSTTTRARRITSDRVYEMPSKTGTYERVYSRLLREREIKEDRKADHIVKIQSDHNVGGMVSAQKPETTGGCSTSKQTSDGGEQTTPLVKVTQPQLDVCEELSITRDDNLDYEHIRKSQTSEHVYEMMSFNRSPASSHQIEAHLSASVPTINEETTSACVTRKDNSITK